MIAAYGSAAVRQAEEPLLARGVPLMEWAAGAIALAVAREVGVYGRRILVLAGPGNNGADAALAGAELARRGAAVTLAGFGAQEWAVKRAIDSGCRLLDRERTDEGGLTSGDVLAAAAARCDVWVDGLLGIGGRPGLRGDMERAVETLAPLGAKAFVVAVDVPSGVDATTGRATGSVLRADLTVTMGCMKPGLVCEPGRRYAGRIHVVDLGLALGEPEVMSLEAGDLAWPEPGPDSHKYTRGVVGVLAGSPTYPGAASLCVEGALGAGPGMVRYVGAVPQAVLARRPEVVCGPGRVDSWVIGPGLDADQLERARGVYREALDTGIPTVLDAGATRFAAEGAGERVVLTPHAGELAALMADLGDPIGRNDIEACPLEAARRAAQATGVVVLLKGATDVVTGARGPAYVQSGPAWRATAGAGDVLAGIVGSALAAGLEPVRAAAEAAYLHGAASLNRPMFAMEIAQNLGAARVAH